jgi:hypothetical protein
MLRKFNPYQLQPSTSILYVREGDEVDPNKIKITPEIQKLIDTAVSQQTQGLVSKRDELLANERKLKDKLKEFDGFDPAAMKALKDRLDQDDDAKLLAEGKKQQVIEKYTERMRAQHASELEALNKKLQEADQRTDRYRGAVLDNHIRAVTSDLHKGAVEDALLHARQLFSLDDKGNAVQLDSEGNPVLGKDGKTPFTPKEWIELQKELKPHWFPSNTTGSNNGNPRDGSSTNGKTIKRADFERLGNVERAEAMRKGTKIID